MSKKYDEFKELTSEEALSLYLLDKRKVPMIPMKIDEKLQRELRDRFIMDIVKRAMAFDMEIPLKPCKYNKDPERTNSIIALVKRACLVDYDITYGEVLYRVDNDISELEYERSKRAKNDLGSKGSKGAK